MKNPWLIVLFMGLIFFACSKEEVEVGVETEILTDLTGEWIGRGYTCPGSVDGDQMIAITHDLETGKLIATKITGDDCVTAGTITFFGDYEGKSKTFQVTITTGLPNNSNSGQANITMSIKNRDHFVSDAARLIFLRN